MSIVVSNIRQPLGNGEKCAIDEAIKQAGLKRRDVTNAVICNRAVDARRKNNIYSVYSVAIDTNGVDESRLIEKLNDTNIRLKTDSFEAIVVNSNSFEKRPVVVGLGPCGLFAALLLAESGHCPIVIERGDCVEKRTEKVNKFWSGGTLDINSNVQFGEGGAGTFSDGKLTTRINDERCNYVLKRFVEFGAPLEITKLAKPHIGTDNLVKIVKNMREHIIKLGGEVHFNTRLTDIKIGRDGSVQSIFTEGKYQGEIETNYVFLAIGHSSRDTYEMLIGKSVQIIPKSFSVGVRVEHLQSFIDNAMYGEYAGHSELTAADYALSYREKERGVYSFCMCPGGQVVASASEEGGLVTNGMSNSNRDGKNANSAIVVGVSPDDFGTSPLDGIKFQRELERKAFEIGGKNWNAPVQSVEGYLKNKTGSLPSFLSPTYTPGVSVSNINSIFPPVINEYLQLGFNQFDKKIKGFISDGIITAVESRTSAPVRICRGDNGQATGIHGLYPAGEGAGYAGGIMSAAVDGIKVVQLWNSKE